LTLVQHITLAAFHNPNVAFVRSTAELPKKIKKESLGSQADYKNNKILSIILDDSNSQTLKK